ncbi:MAG TPA: hypothetical protein PKO36_05700 [Candidatus Hydrogenedentes bacterium]|nr:hypothetical protein [Candidatus Hydrogenedentota bacterium]HOV75544.1 hypothetical protein [Candidatus Hydrogenedentota bacterium]HPC16439.1 hypothetical protein [Candidatus Hydrogenedentota bacterium]HRT20150.1 hypothetical protein [Candidatus Hydrogenedentota bacterium]HRT63184.1 hypothetical protein [Candidatus Hydrogenedentota bacterium]
MLYLRGFKVGVMVLLGLGIVLCMAGEWTSSPVFGQDSQGYRLPRCQVISRTQEKSGVVITSVLLYPERDATLYQDASGALANGAGQFFFCGTNASSVIRRGLIYFNIMDNVPAGVTITDVELRMYMSGGTNSPTDVKLHRAQNDWGEGGSNPAGSEEDGVTAQTGDSTWLHRFYSTDVWASTGGDFATTASA